jgi:hypothetical protein
MFVLFGIIFIALGVISLVKRDWMWTLTRIGNDLEGEASHRNELWELRTAIGGVVFIIIGIILILMGNGPQMPSLEPVFPGPPFPGPPFPEPFPTPP